MQILQVIPITKSITSEVLTYFSIKRTRPGQLVTVPLRKKEISAIIVSVEDVVDMKAQLRGAKYQIRNIIQAHDGYVFSPAFLSTCHTIKNFYATSTGRIIERFTPSFILKDLTQYIQKKVPGSGSEFTNKILQRSSEDRIAFYKTLIREKFLRGESLHIICPTIQSCVRLFDELQKHNTNCITLHSNLTKKTTSQNYQILLSLDKPSLLVSTALYLDTPQHNKSTIIIEQESSEYYYSMNAPYTDARIFIEEYAKQSRSECIWADSVLRPETWHKHTETNTEIIEPLSKRIFKNNDIQIIDQHQKKPGRQTDEERIKELTEKKKFSFLSDQAREYIQQGLEKQENIFLFTYKKSLSPSIVCNDCGNLACSQTTGHPFSLYIQTHAKTKEKKRIFICNATGESIPAFDTCQFCNSWNLVSLGVGTEGVYQEIRESFPDSHIHIIDGNHTKTKKEIKEVLHDYTDNKISTIIIGTQRAIPLLETIDRSVIVSLDSYFGRMSHSTHAQILTLLTDITERTVGPTLLQSRNITQDSLPILSTGLYREYVEKEVQERKQFNYPPFSTLCVIKRSTLKSFAKKEYQQLESIFKEYNPQIMIYPGKTKTSVLLIIILELDPRVWNISHQDTKLWNILSSFDRKTEIHINPKDLL